jgi:hypothetical protein
MFVTLSEAEMRLYSLEMAFDIRCSRSSSAQADTVRPFETASFGFEKYNSAQFYTSL